VARALGTDITGAGAWMLLFVASIIAGSLAYLALQDAGAGAAVGASGGVSGIVAATVLLDPFTGRKRPLWNRDFLVMTAVFAAINVVLVYAGPMLLGMGIAWEAHAGGYVAGALLMCILPLRGLSRPQS
jgi:membrane associated rhomboid family serine protease